MIIIVIMRNDNNNMILLLLLILKLVVIIRIAGARMPGRADPRARREGPRRAGDRAAPREDRGGGDSGPE